MTTERRRPARERLLNAADELMFVDGVVLTPVDDILRRAGAAPATLYSNFGNKDGLIAAALERRLEDWTDAWDAAIADADWSALRDLPRPAQLPARAAPRTLVRLQRYRGRDQPAVRGDHEDARGGG